MTNPNAPEISVERQRFVVDDLRRDKLRSTQHLPHLERIKLTEELLAGLHLSTGQDLPGETKVYKLDDPRVVAQQHHVFRLEVNTKMKM